MRVHTSQFCGAEIHALLCEAQAEMLASISFRPPHLIKEQNNQISCHLLSWKVRAPPALCCNGGHVLTGQSTSDDESMFIMRRMSADQTNATNILGTLRKFGFTKPKYVVGAESKKERVGDNWEILKAFY